MFVWAIVLCTKRDLNPMRGAGPGGQPPQPRGMRRRGRMLGRGRHRGIGRRGTESCAYACTYAIVSLYPHSHPPQPSKLACATFIPARRAAATMARPGALLGPVLNLISAEIVGKVNFAQGLGWGGSPCAGQASAVGADVGRSEGAAATTRAAAAATARRSAARTRMPRDSVRPRTESALLGT